LQIQQQHKNKNEFEITILFNLKINLNIMASLQRLSTCLWFDNQGEDAARFYVSIFKNSSLGHIVRYGKEGFEIHGRPEGSVMTVDFILEGSVFMALNGGPHFKFNEAISIVINCETQEEINYYWEKLKEGGDPSAQQCGWLKDKFGLSWQVVPVQMSAWMKDPDPSRTEPLIGAMLKMKKLDIAELKRAYEGK